ncbi:type I polyketide synthase [Nocardia miyunensis]|uniref:type I polyketide synthase n=1 Tax=Nocardia miyunensis TaxID=282684 RepID=UPI00082B219C|nr:type I polyketide synthase [Nocardia miyunensis]
MTAGSGGTPQPAPDPGQRDSTTTTESDAASVPPVAIIGIGARVPGAHGVGEFWRLLREGRDGTGAPPRERAGARRGGYLHGLDAFDNDWFTISEREAAVMDPQQRLGLEVSIEALDDAGVGYRVRGSHTAVLFGACGYDHGTVVLGRGGQDAPYAVTGSALSIVANRLSYALDLHGPSLVLDSACSSSLAAVDMATRLLADHTVELAIVGGVNLPLLQHTSDYLDQAGFLAPDGRCKPFDAAADGYTRSDGCTVLILQRTADARREGNRVYAEIIGAAVGSDGRSNGLYAPNGLAQQQVIRRAWTRAGVTPALAGYVECHGTGTPLGDAVEVGALASALSEGERTRRVWIGSVKSNLGHLEAAAGVTGVAKAALCIAHATIVPNVHFHTENPLLNLAARGLAVPTEPIGWAAESASGRYAGVSSFGFGGTNAHVVLRGVDHVAPQRESDPPVLLTITGRDADDLREQAVRGAEALSRNIGSLAEFASATTRAIPEQVRAAVVARDRAEAVARLLALAEAVDASRTHTATSETTTPAGSATTPATATQTTNDATTEPISGAGPETAPATVTGVTTATAAEPTSGAGSNTPGKPTGAAETEPTSRADSEATSSTVPPATRATTAEPTSGIGSETTTPATVSGATSAAAAQPASRAGSETAPAAATDATLATELATTPTGVVEPAARTATGTTSFGNSTLTAAGPTRKAATAKTSTAGSKTPRTRATETPSAAEDEGARAVGSKRRTRPTRAAATETTFAEDSVSARATVTARAASTEAVPEAAHAMATHPDSLVRNALGHNNAARVHGPSGRRLRGRILLVFSGQGGQHQRMGRGLAARYPVFARTLAEATDAVTAAGGPRVWTPRHGFANSLETTDMVQPALFVFQIALAELLAHWGIRADAVIGHSLGEIAAAVVSGALSLGDGARIAVVRSAILAHLDGRGAMAMLEATPEEAARLVEPVRAHVAVAAVNGPRSVVVSGTPRYVETVIRRATRRSFYARRIAVDFAAHSPQVREPAAELLAQLDGIMPRAPRIPLYSTTRRGEMIVSAALDAKYWSENAERTVELAAALESAAADGCTTAIEISPHPILAPAIREYPDFGEATHPMADRDDESAAFLDGMARLYLEGRSANWSAQGAFTGPMLERRWRHATFPLLTGAGPEPASEDLGDHVVRGVPMVPATYWLRQLLRIAGERTVRLTEFTVREPTDLTALADITFHAGTDLLEVTGPITLATARIAAEPSPAEIVGWMRAIDAHRIAQPGMHPIDTREFYAMLRARGLDYGPRFRPLRGIVAESGSAIGLLGHIPLDAAALDGCLQLIAAAAAPHLPAHVLPLPTRIDSAWLTASPDVLLAQAHAFLRDADPDGLHCDVLATDQHGAPAAALLGIRIHYAHLAAPTGSPSESPRIGLPAEPDTPADGPMGPDPLGNSGGGGRDASRIRLTHTGIFGGPVARPNGPHHDDLGDSAVNDRRGDRDSAPQQAVGRSPSDDTQITSYRQRGHRSHTGDAFRGPTALPDTTRHSDFGNGTPTHRLGVGGASASAGQHFGEYTDSGMRQWDRTGAAEQPVRDRSDWDRGVLRAHGLGTVLRREAWVRVGVPDAARAVRSSRVRRVLVIGESRLAVGLARATDRWVPAERVARDPFEASPIVAATLTGRADPTAVVAVWPAVSAPGSAVGEIGRALELLQRIQDCDAMASLTVVLRDRRSVAQQGIAGLVRSLQLESGRRVRLVWTGAERAEPGPLTALALSSEGPDEVRIGPGGVEARQFEPVSFLARPVEIRPVGAYVVTGGLGALGAVAARWLLDSGAGDVVVLTRHPRPLPPLLEGLEDRIVVLRCDVTDPRDLANALHDIRECGAPIRGLIHSAGSLHDAEFSSVTTDLLASMFEPKLAATADLLDLTADDPIDFALLFSSATGALGAPGQAAYAAANAALDALASSRTNRRVISIGWGSWESGLAATAGGAEHLRRAGVTPFSTARGTAVLDSLRGYPGPHVLAMDYTPTTDDSPIAQRLRTALQPIRHHSGPGYPAPTAPSRDDSETTAPAHWGQPNPAQHPGDRTGSTDLPQPDQHYIGTGLPVNESGYPGEPGYFDAPTGWMQTHAGMPESGSSIVDAVASASGYPYRPTSQAEESPAPGFLAGDDGPEDGSAESQADRPSVPGSGAAAGNVSVAQVIRAALAATLGITAESIGPDVDFGGLGLSSLLAIELRRTLEARLGIRIATAELFEHPTVAMLGTALSTRLSDDRGEIR